MSKPVRRLPIARYECIAGVRPCPHVRCRHHLYADVVVAERVDGTRAARLRLAFPGLELEDLRETCALDVADRGESLTLEQVGGLVGLTRERVRQLEEVALGKLAAAAPELEELAADAPAPDDVHVETGEAA